MTESTTIETCVVCELTYEGGNHTVDDSGRFTVGGHYFEENEGTDD